MSVASLSNVTLEWRRRTYPADGSAPTTALLGTFTARVNPLSGAERKQYATELASVTHRIYIAGSVSVRASDLLRLPDGTDLIVRVVRDIDLLGFFATIDAEAQT